MEPIIIVAIISITLFFILLYKSIFTDREHFIIPFITISTFLGCLVLLNLLTEKLNIQTESTIPYLDSNYNEDTDLSIIGYYILFLSGMVSWRINMLSKKIIFKLDDLGRTECYKWKYTFLGVTVTVMLIYPITISDINILFQTIYDILIVISVYKYFINKYHQKNNTDKANEVLF